MNTTYTSSTSLRELLTVIILTKNESIHIERAVRSALQLTPNVIVIDSDSTDGTKRLAEECGAQVVSASFSTFADKLNWCINELVYTTPWILRLDADEFLHKSMIIELPANLKLFDEDITAIFVRRQLWFMGKHMRFGGIYPNYSIRIWRTRAICCEPRELDEHFILRYGTSVKLKADIIDSPKTSITHWIDKHNRYATLEAKVFFQSLRGEENSRLKKSFNGTTPERNRWLKANIFYKFPVFFRSFGYFTYRYFIRLGFLDGLRGFLFHFYHGFWYRLLVDTIIMEKKSQAK